MPVSYRPMSFEFFKRADEIFWGYVKRGEPDECWEWQGPRRADGYGRFNLDYKEYIASRVSHLLDSGSICETRVVRHTCDNPPCVNPRHLLSGTQAENLADCLSRGRWADNRGERCGAAKLTEAQVREILTSPLQGVALAAKFGVTKAAICDIQKRRKWAHVQITADDIARRQSGLPPLEPAAEQKAA